MATTVQNSDKKYLNFDGLAYYDGKLKKWIGDNYAPITGGADATESMRLWNEFLAESDKTADGKLQALPTLKTLKDNATAGAEAKILWNYFLEGITDSSSPAPTLKTIDDELYVSSNGTKISKLDKIVGNKATIGTSVGFSGGIIDSDALSYSGTSNHELKIQAQNFASNIGNATGESIIEQWGRLGLAEANLSFTIGTLIDFEEHVIGENLEHDAQYEHKAHGIGGLDPESVDGDYIRNYGRLGIAERYIGNINYELFGSALGTSVDNDANGTGLVYKMAWFDNNKAELNKAFRDYTGGDREDAGYLLYAFGSLGTAICYPGYDYWSLDTSAIKTANAYFGSESVKDNRNIGVAGRLGLVESNLAWTADKAIDAYIYADAVNTKVDSLSKELTGNKDAAEGSDERLGRVGVLEQKIGKLTNATSWIGVVTAKPTSSTVTINGESITCVAGDIVTVVNDKPAETGLEYIYDGTNWVELGDSSGSRSRLTEVERVLSEDVVLKDDFATEADIDTLFASA